MTKPISMQKTRPPVAMLAGPKIHIRASTGDMSEVCSKLRKIVTRAAEESLDSFATLYCDIDGQTMVEMATARNLGFPISAKSMHNIARKRRLTELTFDEEIAEAKKEDEEGFVFKKGENGDMADSQPNNTDDPANGKKPSNVPGQKTGAQPTK